MPAIKLHYHEGIYHWGLLCGQDDPHMDRWLGLCMMFLHQVHNSSELMRWFPVQGSACTCP